uniref:AlNc14C706G12421 protein n=1 Tax=Albugo laibachii Nc14 TaxID=890382 RepID=F0X1V7_9STRA|nr:AlNc14C706G12421 [Albugo laibachii Nc14]|eukprot:CCA27814.1 AlNc14C706G12421 [Albugo laibachii Nc14]
MSVRAPTRQGQQSPADLDNITTGFTAHLEEMCDISESIEYTMLTKQNIPMKTLIKRGERTVWVKCGGAFKNRAAVRLLGDSNGHRYPPFVVFKTASARIQRHKSKTRRRDAGSEKGLERNQASS